MSSDACKLGMQKKYAASAKRDILVMQVVLLDHSMHPQTMTLLLVDLYKPDPTIKVLHLHYQMSYLLHT